MGKRIRGQRRGKGSRKWIAPSHRYKTKPKYFNTKEKSIKAEVIDIINDPSRNSPVAKIRYNDVVDYILAPESMKVGDIIEIGTNTSIGLGNVLCLGNIPEGTPIFNIELQPGDGGKLVRSSGGYALIMSQSGNKTVIKLPSKSLKTLNSNCKATIGILGGSGRKSKPIGKAGKNRFIKRARGKLFPVTSAVSMNAVNHPFGGSAKPGKSKSTKRTAPPGAKVGSFGGKRSGKKR